MSAEFENVSNALDLLRNQTQDGFIEMREQMQAQTQAQTRAMQEMQTQIQAAMQAQTRAMQEMQTQIQAAMQATLERVDVIIQERFTGMATMLAAQIDTSRTRG